MILRVAGNRTNRQEGKKTCFEWIDIVEYNCPAVVVPELDCGMPEVQTLSYDCCRKMLGTDVPGLSKKNGMCRIRFQEQLPSLKEIAVRGFRRKCSSQRNPQVKFLGIPGMHKLANEIDEWPKTLSEEDYIKVLRSFCQFTGTVPSLPERLYGCPHDVFLHQACRDKYSKLLIELSSRCQIEEWKEAAAYFEESGHLLQNITDRMVEYLLRREKEPGNYKNMILQIADLEEKANQLILNGCEQSGIQSINNGSLCWKISKDSRKVSVIGKCVL